MRRLYSSAIVGLMAFVLGVLGGTVAVHGASGDLWNIRGAPGGGLHRDVWHIDSAGDLVPGTNKAYNIGSDTYRVDECFIHNPTFGRLAVAANTTLTSSSPIFIGITNITATTTVGNASSFPIGKPFVLKNETGSGVCPVTSVSNLNGASWATNVTNTTALRIYNDGTGWQSY